MKELETPTGNLLNPKTNGLFSGTLSRTVKDLLLIFNGEKTIEKHELELCVTMYSLSALECVKMLKRYISKMKPEHPAIQEFELHMENLTISLKYFNLLKQEYTVSRQRNADLELALFKERIDKKELEAEIERLKKQNELLIAEL